MKPERTETQFYNRLTSQIAKHTNLKLVKYQSPLTETSFKSESSVESMMQIIEENKEDIRNSFDFS